jgi:hypothetical protein
MALLVYLLSNENILIRKLIIGLLIIVPPQQMVNIMYGYIKTV